MKSLSTWLTSALLAALFAPAAASLAARPASSASSRAIFERRILPLLNAPNPSSCSECHLSGVDLKDYIGKTEAATYASLVKQGLIDRNNPAGSKLLRLIKMSSPKSSTLTRKMRDVEYQAFAAWIQAAGKNGALTAAAVPRLGPKVPDAVIRHTRMDRVLASFTSNIWSQQGRCAGCHTVGSPGAEKYAKEHRPGVAWIVANDPDATMRRLVEIKAVDLAKPERSTLLLKPLGAVDHGGGVKFAYGDRTFRMFLSWIQDYARSARGDYRTVQSLPPAPETRLAGTGSILEIVDAPEAWLGKSLRVDLFAWDAAANAWSAQPIATADRLFNRGHGSLLPVARVVRTGSEEERAAWKDGRLPAGRYLLKFHLGEPGKASRALAAVPDVKMRYLGQQEITAEWKAGRDGSTKVVPALDAG